MKANPNEFKPGNIVLLDNKHEVEILNVSKPSELFCTIKGLDSGDIWDVMTRRLTTKKTIKNEK